MSWEKKKRRGGKKCQIFASAMYSSYQAGVSPEGGLEVGKTLWFFSEALSLPASSPLWASEASLARTRLGPSLARSREAYFACPNRRACSQAKKPFARKLIYSGAKWRFIEQYVYWNIIQDKTIFGLWRNILRATPCKYRPKWGKAQKIKIARHVCGCECVRLEVRDRSLVISSSLCSL